MPHRCLVGSTLLFVFFHFFLTLCFVPCHTGPQLGASPSAVVRAAASRLEALLNDVHTLPARPMSAEVLATVPVLVERALRLTVPLRHPVHTCSLGATLPDVPGMDPAARALLVARMALHHAGWVWCDTRLWEAARVPLRDCCSLAIHLARVGVDIPNAAWLVARAPTQAQWDALPAATVRWTLKALTSMAPAVLVRVRVLCVCCACVRACSMA